MFPGRVLTSIALALSAPLMASANDRTANLDARLLAAHNRERAALGIPALAWDPALAATGRFQHSPADPADPDVEGENLWAGTRGAWAPEEMVGLWLAERRDYRPGIFPAVSRSGDLGNVGHYTQIVWRNTRKVGCALAAGSNEDILVCRYSEGGNVIGERVL
jgi:hypothetical protein